MNKSIIEAAGEAIDLAGVAVIVIGALMTTVIFGYRLFQRRSVQETYQKYRRGLGRAILLGLEFLVAADIIRTVAVSPTFAGVGVLAVIVLVRTILSFSLEVELEGRWPWQAQSLSRQTQA
ncbi:DUF1622 domain-containing protein [Nonomuraea sp. MCN248]|uniref:DUF1622 domain-containing protein n=1 Tax=Nonomuraea corallina TaxID=2989783 RepID=A0ABT4SK32_9ACTN|nr:DUF1622 domain-containing protein [Nonomuraea corallina]MDA0637465.1 DUF1622 domain-containing protein [Nonomuraea corallina]